MTNTHDPTHDYDNIRCSDFSFSYETNNEIGTIPSRGGAFAIFPVVSGILMAQEWTT